ncbi:hypothetical protein ACOSQ3_008951 [Xanthoceras sorbifolium]
MRVQDFVKKTTLSCCGGRCQDLHREVGVTIAAAGTASPSSYPPPSTVSKVKVETAAKVKVETAANLPKIACPDWVAVAFSDEEIKGRRSCCCLLACSNWTSMAFSDEEIKYHVIHDESLMLLIIPVSSSSEMAKQLRAMNHFGTLRKLDIRVKEKLQMSRKYLGGGVHIDDVYPMDIPLILGWIRKLKVPFSTKWIVVNYDEIAANEDQFEINWMPYKRLPQTALPAYCPHHVEEQQHADHIEEKEQQIELNPVEEEQQGQQLSPLTHATYDHVEEQQHADHIEEVEQQTELNPVEEEEHGQQLSPLTHTTYDLVEEQQHADHIEKIKRNELMKSRLETATEDASGSETGSPSHDMDMSQGVEGVGNEHATEIQGLQLEERASRLERIFAELKAARLGHK